MTTAVHSPSPQPTLSLSTAEEVVRDALEVVTRLSDVPLVTSSSVVDKRTQAALSRQLLNAADQLALASALVRNAYWQNKGETSYDL